MAVGFKVKFYWYQIGDSDFLHSFFSTVAYNLENGNWGSRFPVIMNELYQGKLECDKYNQKRVTKIQSWEGSMGHRGFVKTTPMGKWY